MYNCHDDLLAYHNHKVTLPQPERQEMRDRRDTNRDRLQGGLQDDDPDPKDFQSQGSYAHHTMVRHPNKDYDIDDGVIFLLEDLKGPRGGNKTPHEAKEMVRIALHSDQFNEPPEVRTNCVRVHYEAGYHVDVPVYREVETEDNFGKKETHLEIASSEWKLADPAGVTEWFNQQNTEQSPDKTNGRQMRRIVRLIKAFARSRDSWPMQIASGFMISTLVVERYCSNEAREDVALYDTIAAIKNRLDLDLQIMHPVVNSDQLTKGHNDTRAKFLRERLDWAISKLSVLFQADCTHRQALKAWDAVFNTNFFIDRLPPDAGGSPAGSAGTSGILVSGQRPRSAVHKRGGGRYA